MAVRQATRRYPDLASFLSEYSTTLAMGVLVIPGEALNGEPAPEIKVDLVLPIAGRVGPIVAQLVSRLPDGGAAVRFSDLPTAVDAAIRQLLGIADEVKGWLLASGQLVPPTGSPVASPDEIKRLETRIRELEAKASRPPAPPSGTAAGAEGSTEPRSRGFHIPAVDHLPPALSGALGDRSLRDAFMALAVEKQTGLLTIRRPDGRVRWGFWSKGGPVGWRSEPIEEQEVLGVLLFRAESITKEQLATSLEVMERSGCRQGEALIEMGLCTFPQVVLMLQKQVDFIFQRVLREHEGTWTFHLLPELPERFLTPPLRVASILYRALLTHARGMPAQELASALRGWLDSYVMLSPGVERTVEEMKLNAEEQQFIEIIQRTPYRLREIFSVSSLSRSQTAAAIWSLHDLNLLELRTQSSGVRERESYERDVAARLGAAKAKTLFERMDLHWICTTPEVEASYKALKQEWRMELVPTVGDQHRAAFEEINRALDDAYRVLVNDAQRREYRLSVIERGKIEQSAELLSRQGEMAIMKSSSRDAMNCYSKALELVPNNVGYREGLTRSRNIPGS